MSQKPKIRLIALGIFMHDDKIFVAAGRDPVKEQTFYRPIGGGIEFGETGAEALVREIREEVGAEIEQVAYLGTLENIFVYANQPGHEIVRCYSARFVDPAIYQQTEVTAHEDNGTTFTVTWQPLADFLSRRIPLYPTGLPELLRQHLAG